MGDDVTVVVPTTESEQTEEEIGQELVDLLSSVQSRLDNLVIQIGEQNARIAILEERCAELGGRIWAEVGHEHPEFAPAGHSHPEHALIEHSHEAPPKERDTAPEKQHPYFRRFGS
jgi:hypothetical protein